MTQEADEAVTAAEPASRHVRRTARRADRRARRPVEVVPMPVPTRTRVFAGIKLVVLTTILGLVAAGLVVGLGLAVASAVAGI